VQSAARTLQIGVLLAMAGSVACRHASEKALLDEFFSTSRLRDRTASQSIATVFFDPKDQGLVRTFTITSVTPEEQSGGLTSKNVTIRAAVESLAGATSDKTIFVTMQRRGDAGWMITGVTVASVPSPPPR
jgi:hypothetical protein